MLRKCCVPGCNSNYALNGVISEYVPCFSFPKEQFLHKQWMQNIPRKYWTPSESTVVCIKHFDPDCLELEVSYKNTDGEVKTFLRDRPKLKAGSLPTIFDRLRAYLSEKTPVRKSSEDLAMEFKELQFENNGSPKPRHRKRTLTGRRELVRKKLRRKILQGIIHIAGNDPNGTSRMTEMVTVMCGPNYSQESLRMREESKEEYEAVPQISIKQEVVVKEEMQDPLDYLEEFREEQWSENNLCSREDLMEGDSNALCEAVPHVWVKEEIEVKEEIQDQLDYVEETSEEQPSCS